MQGVLHPIDWYPGLPLGGEEAVTVVGEVDACAGKQVIGDRIVFSQHMKSIS
jgi:hypothetical protein